MISGFISEKKLNNAAKLVRCSMLETLPQEVEGHFSEDFQRRISELKKIQKKREKYQQCCKRLVAAVAAFFATSILVLTFNTEARAAVFSWFRETFDTYTIYWFNGVRPDKLPAFELSYIPDEYECVYDETLTNTRTMLYLSNENKADGFTFQYGFTQIESPLMVDYSGTEITITEITINDCSGHLYTSSDPSQSHALIWIDEPNGIVFTITSFLDPEVMLHIAESAKLVK